MTSDTVGEAAELAHLLWPDSDIGTLWNEYRLIPDSSKDDIFLMMVNTTAVAFAHCSLRSDYVEGSSSSPVAFLEAIYVQPRFRRQGVARQLLEHCRSWARDHGCAELASDVELDNTDSQHFHEHSGFKETNRIVTYIQKL